MPGIDLIRFYTPSYYLDLKSLARARQVDPAKFYLGLGQEQMAVPPPDEDVVTMGANAARGCLEETEPEGIDMLIFATESGIDQAKAGAIYIHRLLDLPSQCQAFEIKQACYASTAALQLALDHVAQRPERRVLIVASDIARYGLGSAGEPTQGAGAAAILVSAAPRLFEVEPAWGSYTEDVMDFWRPNYRDEALVDGKFSLRMYLAALAEAWAAYRRAGGHELGEFKHFCYHQPFAKMALKAQRHLEQAADRPAARKSRVQLESGLRYNRRLGNTYTASLYISLLSLLEQTPADLAGERVGLFSYGSGCTGALFGGTVRPGYRRVLAQETHEKMLGERLELDIKAYEDFYESRLPGDGRDCRLPRHKTGAFRLAGIKAHQRLYEKCAAQLATVSHPRKLNNAV